MKCWFGSQNGEFSGQTQLVVFHENIDRGTESSSH